MRVLAIVSAKGGVGKTTVCANLCTALRMQNEWVIGIDMDPQNALRFHLGLNVDEVHGSAPAALAGTALREACFQARLGVYVLPYGDIDEGARAQFEDMLERDPLWLRHALQALALPPQAWVLIDTPPGPSVYIRQALAAADVAVVTTLADAASYATLPLIERLIATYSESRPGFLGTVFVVNQANQARQLARDVAQVMQAQLGDRLIGLVHQDQAVGEALASSQSVLEYDPHSQSTRDFNLVARWLRDHLHTS
ncbi:cellulose synthase operon protein YhjQ [Verticiella sediminum]|uniref:Cellulose synthase operon protein YhjQ n=1 Tax=Verticiella sediminum TaxID=1247510 RepID=A0A556AYR9_9BURK|nr:cellulose biosynthesis protein BcsQ [Verticiella sediminum]TSH97585.1 cellulose synthase operon protein YhjQ [Verticiella sediminum]